MNVFALIVGEMYPVGLCLHILPDVLWYDVAGSWSGLRSVLGSVRFLFERYQASWISQQKVVESASLLNLWGFSIMRTKLATTAFKMPLTASVLCCPHYRDPGASFKNGNNRLPLLHNFCAVTKASLYFNKGSLLSAWSDRVVFHLFKTYYRCGKLYRSDFTISLSGNGSSQFFRLWQKITVIVSMVANIK